MKDDSVLHKTVVYFHKICQTWNSIDEYQAFTKYNSRNDYFQQSQQLKNESNISKQSLYENVSETLQMKTQL